MGAASSQLHEDKADLSVATVDRHRAMASLLEELEAIDWYDQRAEATKDQELRAILLHNRDEEVEHASMVLEWLRRRHPVLDENLRDYLFTTGSIVRAEAEKEGGGGEASSGDGSLGIGSLRGSSEGEAR
jgi:ferritin-like protein